MNSYLLVINHTEIRLSQILKIITYLEAEMPLNKKNAVRACFPSKFRLLLLTWLFNLVEGNHCQPGQERGERRPASAS